MWRVWTLRILKAAVTLTEPAGPTVIWNTKRWHSDAHPLRRLPGKPSPLQILCGPVPAGFPEEAASPSYPQCAPLYWEEDMGNRLNTLKDDGKMNSMWTLVYVTSVIAPQLLISNRNLHTKKNQEKLLHFQPKSTHSVSSLTLYENNKRDHVWHIFSVTHSREEIWL